MDSNFIKTIEKAHNMIPKTVEWLFNKVKYKNLSDFSKKIRQKFNLYLFFNFLELPLAPELLWGFHKCLSNLTQPFLSNSTPSDRKSSSIKS